MNEIADYLQPVKARWKLVVAVTILAILLAALATLPPRVSYRTVAVVGPDLEATSANDRVDFIRNLQAAADTSAVLDVVAQESGLTPERISDGLQVQRIGDSNLTRITYVSDESDPTAATTVVLTLPDAAIKFLRTTRIDEATTRMEEASQAADVTVLEVETLDAAIAQAVEDSDNIRPDLTFDALQAELAALRIRRVSTDAAETPAIAEQLTTAIAGLESRLPAAAVRANEYTVLISRRDSAEAARDEALIELTAAQREFDAATAVPKVSLEMVDREVEQSMSALQQILAIGAAAFVLVVAIILVWSLAVKRDDQSGGGRESIAGGDAVHDDSAPVEDLPHDGLAAGGAPPPDASVSAEDQSPDALSPEGSIEVPASGAALAGPDVVLSGSATDAVGVTRVLATIRDTVSKLWLQSDGVTFGSVESSVQASLDSPGGTSTAWSLAVSLPDGSYAIGIRTFDDTGNVDAAPPWVPFTVASVPADTVSPTGFVDVPVSGAVLAGPSVVLSGSASDDVGVTDVKVTIRDTVGELWLQADAATFGSTYTLLSAELDAPNEPETGWRFALSLPDGTYAIGIKASDAAGNVDASPPWVPFTVAIPKPEAKKSAPRAAKTARQPRKAASGGPPR